jgi:hypothetical protein
LLFIISFNYHSLFRRATKNSQKFQQLLDQVFEDKKTRKKFKELLEAAVKREPYPFANPYYWTAFVATGV